jgi:protein-L-isoaspartate O-methyltransferase
VVTTSRASGPEVAGAVDDAGVEALIAGLSMAGQLPHGYESLLRGVPREWFTPDRIWVNDGGGYRAIDRASEPDQWSSVVYQNRAIVTQFNDGRVRWPTIGDRPTCSTSMPSVVVGMLDALSVEQGHTVLEIGTGTGFNAALLAEQVGLAGRVVTVEIDPSLHEEVHTRLSAYRNITCVLGDGAVELSEHGPFDRVIATAAAQLGRVPYAWVEQTRPGGVIVTPVRAELASGPLVRFTVDDDGTAIGATVPMSVGFMELRDHRTPREPDPAAWLTGDADSSVSDLQPGALLFDPAARWALAVSLPSCRYDIEPTNPDPPCEYAWLHDPLSGSWAYVAPDGCGAMLVRQAGPRRLWDQAQAAYRWWQRAGEPQLSAWQWTIRRDRQTVTLPADHHTD